jgi:hypothetical protein
LTLEMSVSETASERTNSAKKRSQVNKLQEQMAADNKVIASALDNIGCSLKASNDEMRVLKENVFKEQSVCHKKELELDFRMVDIADCRASLEERKALMDKESVALKNVNDSKMVKVEERKATKAEWKEMLEAITKLRSQLGAPNLHPSNVEAIYEEIDLINSRRVKLAKELGIME